MNRRRRTCDCEYLHGDSVGGCAGAGGDSEATCAEPSGKGDCDGMLCAAGAGGVGGAAGRFVGGGKFAQAGDSVADGFDGWSRGGLGGGFVAASALGEEKFSLLHGPAKILTGNIFEQRALLAAPVMGARGITRGQW